MDSKIEDTMVRQIEKNLSNNMNENLFLSGYDNTVRNNGYRDNQADKLQSYDVAIQENLNPVVSFDHLSTGLSRAEYIRQAREACLRQLSAVQIYSKPYDVNYVNYDSQETDPDTSSVSDSNKITSRNTDKETPIVLVENNNEKLENSPQEIASYRSLIIRMVCAVVIFLFIFLIDKFDFKVGVLNHNIIQEYVTGKNVIEELENILVSWFQ